MSQTDNSTNSIATLNPLRYRSYVYDQESGFYYLQSRYYDPHTGRFLNADDTAYLGVTGTALSCNVFAYCENDAVNNVDYKGYAKSKIQCLFTTLTYKYKITKNGVVEFDFKKNDFWTVVWRRKTKLLARKIYNKAKKKDESYLYGRTISGIEVELTLHWIAYKLHILEENANPANIAGIDKDGNACFFETVNAGQIFADIVVSNYVTSYDIIYRIRMYL